MGEGDIRSTTAQKPLSETQIGNYSGNKTTHAKLCSAVTT